MYFGTTTIVYGITALLSLALLLGYLILLKKKAVNLLLLYVAVFVVNLGYFSLAISRTVPEAMLANRIAYLGSVFLPLFMLLIIQDACRIRWHKAYLGVLIGISVCVFLLAASGGYCGLYYKEVSLRFAGGAAVLDKVYGPLHVVYLIYLMAYFTLMIGSVIYAVLRKKIASPRNAAFLAALVLGNIAIWCAEQKTEWNFEFLSVSYILTELFLLMLCRALQKTEQLQESASGKADAHAGDGSGSCGHYLSDRRIETILAQWPGISALTAREVEVLGSLMKNKPRREIAEELCVSENTVKKHTSNIYTKLGVSGRKELCALLDSETLLEQ